MDEMNMNIDLSVNAEIPATADLMQTTERLAQAFADAEASAAELTEQAQSLTDNTPLPPITGDTTLGELLTMLNLTPGQKKPNKTPTPKKLRTTVEQIADSHDCKLYRNGFAYYNNGYSHSVLWLPYCVSYTYHFNPLRDSEKDYLKEKADLPEGLLESTAWPVVVTMMAEHRIENHMDTNAGIGHADVPDYADDEDEQGVDSMEVEDRRCKEFMWHEDPIGVNPLEALIRKETREEVLDSLTDKQRKVFILYHKYEYTQEEIAARLGISQVGVKHHLDCIWAKLRKIL